MERGERCPKRKKERESERERERERERSGKERGNKCKYKNMFLKNIENR